MLRVAIVDLGMGNLRSVQRALERAATDGGVEIAVTISADTHDKARPHVYPRRHAQAEPRFDAGGVSDDSVDPSFRLERLLGGLRKRGRGGSQRQGKRQPQQ